MVEFITEVLWWMKWAILKCCLDISILFCILLYNVLPLLVAILESIRKTSLSCKFLENQNVSVQKLKPFSKTNFSDGESCLSDMLNDWIGKVFSNHFSRRAERRSINHLCWSLDDTDPVVAISLYFTLHLYFGNVVNVPFSKQWTRCWRSFGWSYTISLGLFSKRISLEYAVAKTSQSVVQWYNYNQVNLIGRPT